MAHQQADSSAKSVDNAITQSVGELKEVNTTPKSSPTDWSNVSKYLETVNNSVEKSTDNGINNLPALLEQLSPEGQQATQQILDSLTNENNWEKNWQLQSNKFNQWIDEVLVKEGLLDSNQASLVKDETSDVFKSHEDYRDIQKFTGDWYSNSWKVLVGGIGAQALGIVLFAVGAAGRIRRDF